jgi:hypothetical protein
MSKPVLPGQMPGQFRSRAHFTVFSMSSFLQYFIDFGVHLKSSMLISSKILRIHPLALVGLFVSKKAIVYGIAKASFNLGSCVLMHEVFQFNFTYVIQFSNQISIFTDVWVSTII